MTEARASNAALAADLRAGLNYSQTARRHGLSRHNTRRRALAMSGVPAVGPGRPRADVDIAEVRELRARGMTLLQIGALMGVSEGTIRNRLREQRRAA
jgi:transposase-like protein